MIKTELLEGPCTTRGISLPIVMDQALTRRARGNHRSISKEIQLALAHYLSNDGHQGQGNHQKRMVNGER